jgi:hypothetical protein
VGIIAHGYSFFELKKRTGRERQKSRHHSRMTVRVDAEKLNYKIRPE